MGADRALVEETPNAPKAIKDAVQVALPAHLMIVVRDRGVVHLSGVPIIRFAARALKSQNAISVTKREVHNGEGLLAEVHIMRASIRVVLVRNLMKLVCPRSETATSGSVTKLRVERRALDENDPKVNG